MKNSKELWKLFDETIKEILEKTGIQITHGNIDISYDDSQECAVINFNGHNVIDESTPKEDYISTISTPERPVERNVGSSDYLEDLLSLVDIIKEKTGVVIGIKNAGINISKINDGLTIINIS